MNNKNNKDLLEVLHTELIKELLDRIRHGDAKPSDLNVARQMLKDNGIECLPVPESPFGDLMRSPKGDSGTGKHSMPLSFNICLATFKSEGLASPCLIRSNSSLISSV